jgi:two-component system cell cycle response regulator
MSARILVVDDIEANIRLLEARLTAEYYEVVSALDGPSALAIAAEQPIDLVLLDVMMPGMDGFEVCRRLKNEEVTRHIPIVMVTALDGRTDRITGLDAGADDFLTKPIDDLLLMARVRSLTRMKQLADELRRGEASGRRLGVIAGAASRLGGAGGRILILDDNPRQSSLLMSELSPDHRPVLETEPDPAHLTAKGPVDLVIVNAVTQGFDGLRFAAALRSDEATRHLPILAVMAVEERERLLRAFEIGVSDVLPRPIDPQELGARVRTQIKRKRYGDFLRANLDSSFEMAVTDPLTGLHNRRYMYSQLEALVNRSARGGDPVSTLMIDIDHFKKINDNFGHDMGDAVLREFAARLASNVRAVDLPCRYGGEEFLVIMPGTRLEDAERIAERIRRHAAGSPFTTPDGEDIMTVTISIGVSCTLGEGDTSTALLKRADAAVFEAKAAGRNTVVARAA